MVGAALLSLVVLSSADAASWRAGEDIENAIAIQLSEDGLDNLGALLPGLIAGQGAIPVDDQDFGFSCVNIAITNMWIDMRVVDTRIIPRNSPGPNQARLDVALDLEIKINDPTDKFGMEVFCSNCPGYIDWFPVTMNVPFTLSVVEDPVTGDPVMEAEMGDLSNGLNNGLQGSHIKFDCGIQTVENALASIPVLNLSLYDFIISLAEPILISQIAGQQEDLEQTLIDALAQARFEDEIDLLGNTMYVRIMPNRVMSAQNVGMELGMLAGFAASQAECIEKYDDGTFPKTDTPSPNIMSNPNNADASIHIADDMLNSALYTVWRSGAICMDLDAESLQGLPANSGLLDVIHPEAFKDVVDSDSQPIVVRLDPHVPPEALFDTNDDLAIKVRDLDIEIFTAIDGRMARAVGLGLNVDAGVDLDFDGTTGELAIGLNLEDSLNIKVSPDSLTPGFEKEIAENFEGLILGLVGTLLESLLGDSLTFVMPDMDGLGLSSLTVTTSGAEEDWLAVHAGIGAAVPYAGTSSCGCDPNDPNGGCTGGCDSGSGGCTVMPATAPIWLIALTGAFVRRRRR